ncbi:hypothetical protein D3C86_2071710 [compost metagenome]
MHFAVLVARPAQSAVRIGPSALADRSLALVATRFGLAGGCPVYALAGPELAASMVLARLPVLGYKVFILVIAPLGA